jgi:hypothetical protein
MKEFNERLKFIQSQSTEEYLENLTELVNDLIDCVEYVNEVLSAAVEKNSFTLKSVDDDDKVTSQVTLEGFEYLGFIKGLSFASAIFSSKEPEDILRAVANPGNKVNLIDTGDWPNVTIN